MRKEPEYMFGVRVPDKAPDWCGTGEAYGDTLGIRHGNKPKESTTMLNTIFKCTALLARNCAIASVALAVLVIAAFNCLSLFWDKFSEVPWYFAAIMSVLIGANVVTVGLFAVGFVVVGFIALWQVESK